VSSHQELFAGSLSPKELRDIVGRHLPAWLKACAADSEAIVLHEAAFGMSGSELFLFACAIKYATQHGKTVHVTRDRDTKDGSPESKIAKTFVVKVFREAAATNSRSRRNRTKSAPRSKLRRQNS